MQIRTIHNQYIKILIKLVFQSLISFPFSCVEDSDGCKVRRMFFNKVNITYPSIYYLFGFTISCTTRTVYTVQYITGWLCSCGEYFVDNETIVEPCYNPSTSDFSVEISMEHIRNQWGENCSFQFQIENVFDPQDASVFFGMNLQVLPTGTLTIVFYFRGEN